MDATQAAGLCLIAFVLSEVFLRRGATAKSLKPTRTDRGTTLLLSACYMAVVGILFFPNLPGTVLPTAVAWVGVGAACAGLALRWWAMIVLGRFYTRTLTTTSDQHVVAHGPYRWVRHPGYLGCLLTWVGAAAATRNVLVVVLVLVVLLLAYARRMAVEEAMLVESLGEAYVAYQRRSWRLVPFLF